MVMVTNLTQHSPRSFNVRRGTVSIAQRMVMPGETAELEIFDPANPVYAAWEEAGEIGYDLAEREQHEAAKRAGAPPNVPGPEPAVTTTPVPAMVANPATFAEAADLDPADAKLPGRDASRTVVAPNAGVPTPPPGGEAQRPPQSDRSSDAAQPARPAQPPQNASGQRPPGPLVPPPAAAQGKDQPSGDKPGEKKD